MTPVPEEVRVLADRRAEARASRDWTTADRLRARIEAAGWKVIDSGTAYRLEPAHPPDLEAGGITRYGRSDVVPSRLGDLPIGLASVIVVARHDPVGAARAAKGLLSAAPAGVDVVIVADGLEDGPLADLEAALAGEERVEVIRTSAPLGQGASLGIGLRRARAAVVVVLDASVEPTGDVVSGLVAALGDPSVAVAGPFGLRSADLRRFEEVTSNPAVAIEGYLMAFRRADAAANAAPASAGGSIDEGFRYYRNLDIWLSLVLRDAGEGRPPRAARVVEGLPLIRHEHLAWTSTPEAERQRLSRRNFYRLLDRFRDRLDLATP